MVKVDKMDDGLWFMEDEKLLMGIFKIKNPNNKKFGF